MKKNGFSTIELLVSFVIISFITIAMFRAVLVLNDKLFYFENTSRNVVFTGGFTNTIERDLVNFKVVDINSCGDNCYDIVYQELGTKRLRGDSTEKTLQYGKIIEKLPNDTSFDGSITLTNETTASVASNRYDSILNIKIPLINDIFEENFDIDIIYQYDSRVLTAALMATVYTDSNVTNIESDTATISGTVVDDGGSTITERGIVYGTSVNPTINDTKLVVAGTTGTFSGALTGLDGNTTYHARAYVTNAKGTSYGSDITFTTTASGIDNYVVLMLHMDGVDNGTTFTDETGKTVTVNGNTVTKTGVKKFGTASGYFDGAGDYLSLANSDDWYFGTEDFTIDFWYYKATNSMQMIASQYNVSSVSLWYLENNSVSSQFVFESYTNSTKNASYRFDYNVAPGTWNHYALVRNGSEINMYENGVSMNRTINVNVGSSSLPSTGKPLAIGIYEYDYSSEPLYGYLDEFRISKGIARWTSNFTPPVAPYS